MIELQVKYPNSKKQVPARNHGESKLKVIQDAPGDYVKRCNLNLLSSWDFKKLVINLKKQLSFQDFKTHVIMFKKQLSSRDLWPLKRE